MFKGIDLFSDTVTLPTEAMKKAMLAAELGDEQKGEDPTTRHLETLMAEMTGHEAALFFPSATMANEVAIRLLCEPGDELLAAENCHLFFAEAGGPAIHAGVLAKPIRTQNGIFTSADLHAHYRWNKGPHYPVSKLLSIENTTNMGGGIAWNLQELDDVLNAAQQLNLKTHLDGSRIFNAMVKTNSTLQQLTARFDAVTICFSKGLGCPIGAVLAFSQVHYAKVRRLKQLFGGSMRQSGMLAAAAIYALQNHVTRLAEDHQNAQYLAECLSKIGPQIVVEKAAQSTNMVFFNWQDSKISAQTFLERCIQQGVRFSQVDTQRFRAVTHLNITKQDVDKAVGIVKAICS